MRSPGAVGPCGGASAPPGRSRPCSRGSARPRDAYAIVAEVDLNDLDARELRLVLVQVVDLLLADRRLHDDRGERVEATRVDLAGELSRRDVEDTGRGAARARSGPASGMSPTQSSTAVPATFETTDAAAAVEDRPAGRLHADEPELVRSGPRSGTRRRRAPGATRGGRRGRRRRASANAPENRDAQRELRREPVRLAHARVGREEATGRRALLLVRPGRHRRGRPRPRPTARPAAPRRRARRTSRWTGSARMRFRTKAGASAVTSACRATTSSSSR